MEFITFGLKCDNPKCDWKDESIGLDNYEEYLNTACPECGESVLTDGDMANVKIAKALVDTYNKKYPTKEGEPLYNMKLNLHNTISIESIEKIKD